MQPSEPTSSQDRNHESNPLSSDIQTSDRPSALLQVPGIINLAKRGLRRSTRLQAIAEEKAASSGVTKTTMTDEVVRGEQTSIKAHAETHEVGVTAVEQDVLVTGKPSLEHGEKKKAVSLSEHPCGDNWKKSESSTSSDTHAPEGLGTHQKRIESEKYPR